VLVQLQQFPMVEKRRENGAFCGSLS